MFIKKNFVDEAKLSVAVLHSSNNDPSTKAEDWSGEHFWRFADEHKICDPEDQCG